MSPDGGHGEDAEHPVGGSNGKRLESLHYEDLKRCVLSAVRRHCPSWLTDQAEDIAQNVLVKLLKAERKSDGKQTFSPLYVEKSVCSAVVDEIRLACRRREDQVQDSAGMNGLGSMRESPERNSWSREVARGIIDCLQRLSRPRRLVVTLYLHGCTVPEAAARRGWTLWKTESLVYRGLADLRRCLQRKGLVP